jgi:hypothetical protein
MAKDFLIGKVQSDEPVDTTRKSQIRFVPTWSNLFIPLAISVGLYVAFKIAQHVFKRYYKRTAF